MANRSLELLLLLLLLLILLLLLMVILLQLLILMLMLQRMMLPLVVHRCPGRRVRRRPWLLRSKWKAIVAGEQKGAARKLLHLTPHPTPSITSLRSM